MKYFKKFLWLVLAIHIVLVLIVIFGFKVDDMTLSKGKVKDFNEGWKMVWQKDGTCVEIDELPYLGQSVSGETVILENTIPKEDFGKTMSFLSADKEIKVFMDDELVYKFGVGDKRYFGHTPGSVVNFIDIPQELKEGKIRIEMVSPYADYGARMSTVTIGDRDVLILKLLKNNIFQIFCNLVILICGIIFFLLFLIQLVSKQNTGGMQYLCGYCIVAGLYYSVETKTLHVFYGNQTLYSVLVFLCVMLIPFFVNLYYANSILGIYKKRFQVMLTLICLNIGVQLVLQLCNIVDFMNMAFASHFLICLTVLVVGKSYLDIRKENKSKSITYGMLALICMGLGGIVDIVRMYIVAVGDMGKFSRLGTTCFSVIMLYQHMAQLMKGYSENVEENARLLKNEMELIEKKNEQLEIANKLAEEARQEALAANAAKGKFLAHMSHEIRTPINAVLGMDTMILRESKDMQIKEYALDIQNAGQNLLSLINDILDFSKIESGKLEIIPVEYDFSSLIHDISNMIKAKAKTKKLDLNIHVKEEIPSKLYGDDVRIRQILVNLLNNAVKYTHKGSVTLNVDGKIEGRKVILDFSVEDTGIGIKEEDVCKLFQEFERIEEKKNRNIEGTGLGINITTQFLLLMGSKLNVESVYGKGSRFFFTLEQQIVDSTPIGKLEERIQKQSTEYNYMSTFTAPQANLLVVDDNTMNLKVFVGLLKANKVNIDVAESGKECLEMIVKRHYDLIFLDHMMPEMDGIETLHRMKEMEENRCMETPVIALTANAITGAKEMYLAEGFDAFLSKPVHPEKLEQMILRLLPRDLLKFDVEEETAEVEKTESEPINKDTCQESIDLPMIDGIDWSYGQMHLPDKELLLETVASFYKTLNAEADNLQKFYDERSNPDMLTQYRIKVHSMKSSANLIGATVLGGMAKLLENGARDGDMALLEAMHDIFLREWRSYKEKLKECLAELQVEEGEKEEISDYEVVVSYLDMLSVAMEEMDIDAMDEVMAKLEGFQYTENMQSSIEQLEICVTNLDSDEAEGVIETIKEQIRQGFR
ncbi:MAG: response regulator [Lachnospiraceae bacterium]|nr:response regulator [Lachnospiraceae bacterium]